MTRARNPKREELWFRLHYVPSFAKVLISKHAKSATKPLLGLGEISAHIVAQQRTGLELLCLHSSGQDTINQALANTPLPEWFDLPPVCHAYWVRRFEAWRGAAMTSWQHYLEKRCPRLRHPEVARWESAFVGAAEKLGWLNEELLEAFRRECSQLDPKVIQRVRNDTPLRRCTAKAVDPIQFNTWVYEIWPLVDCYGWNYHQVWRVANSVFDPGFNKVFQVEDRCKALGLKLSPAGQAKRINRLSKSPPMAHLATCLQSVAMDPAGWVHGEGFAPA